MEHSDIGLDAVAIMQFNQESGVHLGYPIAEGTWGLHVIIRNDPVTGKPTVLPLAFSKEQALEIAQRIISYYGTSAVMPATQPARPPPENRS